MRPAGAVWKPAAMLEGPPNPAKPGQALDPFQAVLYPPRAHLLGSGGEHEIDIAETRLDLHPTLPPVLVWGFGSRGQVHVPGPLLEVTADQPVVVRWRNRLPASVLPGAPASLPFVTAVVEDPDPDNDSVQNHLGDQGGTPENTAMAPIGWTSVHLHGGHTRADADGFPDNMMATGGMQISGYDNTADNLDLGLRKVGAFLWYHDHAMNGTRYHVYAGLAGSYFIRDPHEAALGLPTSAEQGEILLMLADRNLTVGADGLRLLHKTTVHNGKPDTAEFFGPLTLVDGKLWPRLPLRPMVYRLRLLNSSNARTYRLHLVSVTAGGAVNPQHDRVLVIGTDGGLMWRPWQLAGTDALTLAPSERIDVLVNLAGLPAGEQLYLINSAPAPFGGEPAGNLTDLFATGDRPGRNPYPWVLRIDIDPHAPTPGRPAGLYPKIAGTELNPDFRRLVHDATGPVAGDEPPPLEITGHAHRTILLAETHTPGHLYLQEIVEDADGGIELQLPGATTPRRYRVENWLASDKAPSSTRVSFYDRISLRPQLRQWQLWRFVNATGDTHPMHIHQSVFQPLAVAGARLVVTDDGGNNLYDPDTRTTSAPLLLDPDHQGRRFEPSETHGWKDVIRVDPGNIVSVAVRFDLPGRYVYHCHIVEHEDTEMMRPFVVTVTNMADGMGGMPM
jgi:spore coat protein A